MLDTLVPLSPPSSPIYGHWTYTIHVYRDQNREKEKEMASLTCRHNEREREREWKSGNDLELWTFERTISFWIGLWDFDKTNQLNLNQTHTHLKCGGKNTPHDKSSSKKMSRYFEIISVFWRWFHLVYSKMVLSFVVVVVVVAHTLQHFFVEKNYYILFIHEMGQ